MRDIVVTIIFLYGLILTVKKPYIGILVWSWLGYMNPHRLCYGFAYSMPFSQIIAIVTLAVFLFSEENKKLPRDRIVLFMAAFVIWMGLSTVFAFDIENSLEQYIKVLKIFFPIFITILMYGNKDRINSLLLVIIFSLGYFGTKGGVFTLLTGGAFRVYGPPSSFVEENNALAVATLMVMPLMVYMRSQVDKPWQKNILLFSLVSMGFSVLGSQSRGAFLAILSVGMFYWLQSNSKFKSGALIFLFVAVAAPFLPESWYERMNSIETYDSDKSSMARITAWTLAFEVANHNLFGGGYSLWNLSTYSNYLEWFDPLKMEAFVAHSIYFSVLGEHGWVGLILYLSIFYFAWRDCSALVKQCKNSQDLQWISNLAGMIKISLLAYFSGGAFLSLAYFDLPWHLVSIVVLLKQIYKNYSVESNFKSEGSINFATKI